MRNISLFVFLSKYRMQYLVELLKRIGFGMRNVDVYVRKIMLRLFAQVAGTTLFIVEPNQVEEVIRAT